MLISWPSVYGRLIQTEIFTLGEQHTPWLPQVPSYYTNMLENSQLRQYLTFDHCKLTCKPSNQEWLFCKRGLPLKHLDSSNLASGSGMLEVFWSGTMHPFFIPQCSWAQPAFVPVTPFYVLYNLPLSALPDRFLGKQDTLKVVWLRVILFL